ncbi:hypothetical protein NQZ79_g3237 [Umbelopsis isabellina]|nr:hypothetical protein NQZ79_g3237 [Umbelopsis isabellina]
MQNTDIYERASEQIGSYMLQGWILTDETCQRSNCHTPLLRSRDGQKKKCVVHDAVAPPNSKHKAINERSFEETAVAVDNTIPKAVDIESDDEAERFIQRVKNNKEEKGSFAAKRREQSKRASELIGQKLLQQWALLDDICPNENCYAVPLVRDPQQRLFCVICEQTYMTEAAYNKQIQNQSNSHSSLTATKADAQPTRVTTQAISKDVNLRDLDLDLDDPEFLETQLQMLRGDLSKQKDTDAAPTKTSQAHSGSTSTSRTELLEQMKAKVDELSLQALTARDPAELVKLFEAIKAGSEAINAYKKIC